MRLFMIIASLIICISANAEMKDSIAVDSVNHAHHKNAFSRTVSKVVGGVERLFDVDTAFVEPSHYHYQAMIQNTNSYEVYRLGDNEGHSIRFSPNPSIKVGPYVGWSLIFLGWSVDITHQSDNNRRKEFDMSFYTMPIGIDLFYRQTGDNYRIKSIDMGNDIDVSPLEGLPFSGVESKVAGINVYYIFNHRKFSYPAAFNQSTRQKVSCGSPLAGFGYTRHSLKVDWQQLNELAIENIGQDLSNEFTNDRLLEKVRYSDLSFSGGYAYNWVFAKNWLFSSSLSLALSYKRAVADYEANNFETLYHTVIFRDFKLADLNIDGVGRFSVNWTNDHWFAGATATFHSFNYNKPEFFTNNTFGSINIYAGVNFGVSKKYRKK